jgi:hypothetical protein
VGEEEAVDDLEGGDEMWFGAAGLNVTAKYRCDPGSTRRHEALTVVARRRGRGSVRRRRSRVVVENSVEYGADR